MLSVNDFAERIKEKYPDYKDIDNKLLTERILEKYPEYKSQVQLEEKPSLLERAKEGIGTGVEKAKAGISAGVEAARELVSPPYEQAAARIEESPREAPAQIPVEQQELPLSTGITREFGAPEKPQEPVSEEDRFKIKSEPAVQEQTATITDPLLGEKYRAVAEAETPLEAGAKEAALALTYTKSPVSQYRKEEHPVAATVGEIAGTVAPMFAGGTGVIKTMASVPKLANIAKAGKLGQVAFNGLGRMTTSAIDYIARHNEELVSEDDKVKADAKKNLAINLAASVASPLPETFLPKNLIQPVAQGATDLIVEVIGQKIAGSDAFNEENLVNTIASAVAGGLFGIADIKGVDANTKAVVKEVKKNIEAPPKTEKDWPEFMARMLKEAESYSPGRKPVFETGEKEFKRTKKIKQGEVEVDVPSGIELMAAKRPPPTEADIELAKKVDIDDDKGYIKEYEQPSEPQPQPMGPGGKRRTGPIPPYGEQQPGGEAAGEGAVPRVAGQAYPHMVPSPELTTASSRISQLKEKELFETAMVPEGIGERGSVNLSVAKDAKNELGKLMQEQLTTRGGLPKEVFRRKMQKEHWINAELKEIENTVSEFKSKATKAYGKSRLSSQEAFELDAALKGEKSIEEIKPELQPIIKNMRNHIDALSQKMIDEGVIEGDLVGKFTEDMGFYANRSYRVFDDPDWAKKVPVETRNRAKAYIRDEYKQRSSNLIWDTQTRLDELAGEKASIQARKRMPEYTVLEPDEETLLAKNIQLEKEADRSYTKIDNLINRSKRVIQTKVNRIDKKLDIINKRKTEIWRGEEKDFKSLEKLESKQREIEKIIAKTEEEQELNDEVISILDDLQGKLAKVKSDIKLYPTEVGRTDERIQKLNDRINDLIAIKTKKVIIWDEQLSNDISSIKTELQNKWFKINKKRTDIYRSIYKQKTEIDEQLSNVNNKIEHYKDRLNKLLSKEELSDAEINGKIDELLYKEDAPIALLAQGKLGSKKLGILKHRKEIPAEIRALWGEYKDADVNYAKSVSKMASLIANHKFLTDVKAEGLGKYFHEKPIVQRGESYSVPISGEETPSMKPLSGLYTTKEIKDAFEKTMSSSVDPAWLRGLIGVSSTAKYAKTILSPMTHLRNVMGNTGFAIMNGHVDVTKAPKAIAMTFRDFANKGTIEQKRYLRELTELGVIGTGARYGEIRDIVKDVTQGDIDIMIGTGKRRAAKKAIKGIEKLYGAEDDVWKVYAFENELQRYKKALPNMSDKEIKEHVANIVRNTYPTYEMIPELVKKVRKFPFVGSFVSFPAEVIRTSANTVKLAMDELKTPELRTIGAQRLAGILTAATITGAATAGARYLTGTNRKKDEAYRTFMGPWSQNSQIIYIGKGKEGEQNYIDLGYTDPHSYIKNVVIAAMRGEDIDQKAMEALGEAFSPFLSEDLMTQKLLDISRNKKKDGTQVWNTEDNLEGKMTKAAAHFADAITPGAIAGAKRMYHATKEGAGKYGQKYDLKTEAIAQSTGVRVSRLNVARSLKYKTFQLRRDLTEAARLKYKGERISEREKMREDKIVSKLRKRFLLTGDLKSTEDTLKSHNISQGRIFSEIQRQKILNKYIDTIRDAMVAGLSSEQIFNILKDSGVPKKDAAIMVYQRMSPEETTERE